MKKTLICLLLVFILWLFNVTGKVEQSWLQLRVHTLESELAKNRNTINAVLEIGSLIDSIDRERGDLDALLDEKKSHQDYSSRLLVINNYILETRAKMERLEGRISRLDSHAPGISETILGLKKKLEKKNLELDGLNDQLKELHAENNTLFRSVSLHEDKLTVTDNRLELKNNELKALEVKIQEAWERKRLIEAEALYGLANSIEVKANRTHFAPEKKRHELLEALDLYKQSLAYGNEEAQMRVEELQSKLDH